MAFDELALDLEADEEKEDRHQPVVDPVMQRLRQAQRPDGDGALGMEERRIGVVDAVDIARDHGGRRRGDEDQPRRRLMVDEGLQTRLAQRRSCGVRLLQIVGGPEPAATPPLRVRRRTWRGAWRSPPPSSDRPHRSRGSASAASSTRDLLLKRGDARVELLQALLRRGRIGRRFLRAKALAAAAAPLGARRGPARRPCSRPCRRRRASRRRRTTSHSVSAQASMRWRSWLISTTAPA